MKIVNGCQSYTLVSVVDFTDESLSDYFLLWTFKIDRPSGIHHSMQQAQGHLCVCTVAGPNDSKLAIWIP